MSNLAWLAISWILVAALCYFIVFRLGRQSPSDEQLETKRDAKPVVSRPVNETEGASTLINNVIKWIHENIDKQFSSFHLQLINALEEAAKKNLHDEPYDLKFSKNIEPGQIDPPEFSNFKFVTGKTNQIAARTHAFIKKATLKLQISKRKNDQFVVNNYEALLSNIETDIEVRVALITNRIHLIICPATAPTSQIILYDNESGRITGPETLELHNIINKAIGAAVVDFELDSLVENGKSQPNEGSTINDVVKRLYHSNDNIENSRPVNTANRLVVNVVRAYDLKIKEVDQQPFVVIEMDEPQRKHVTSASQGANPMWNETFDFDLSNGSDEILFEIYNPTTDENSENAFVGLAIVGINELIRTRNPIQYLKLQGRPYHNDDVSGTLLVQFDFSSDSKASLVGTHKRQIRLVNSNGEQLSETTVHSIKPLGSGMGSLKNVDNLEPIPTKTTTITVKGIQVNEEPKPIQNSYDVYDPHDSQFHPKDDANKRQPSEETNQPSVAHKVIHATQSAEQNRDFYDYNQGYSSDNQRDMSPRIANNRRSGSEKRKRERSFFGDLRERLSKKRKQYGRSKSADPASHSLVEAESVPPSRDQSQVREYDDHARFTGDEDSKCTLVLELQRGGENKYFLIPPSIAREPAAANILKKGKKLHLCKNHTFVAVKSTSGIVCNACGTKVATGFNKQAYQCRACRMICHKACHTHVQSDCHVENPMKLSAAKDVDWAHYLSHSRLTEYISAENL
uniref:C2 domain-containing protein n=1 Tax=Panagrolaimus sp. JU765 TaxID=591449 RepID=A0AC34Q5K2_9BILA